jgi:probable DNA repair protein
MDLSELPIELPPQVIRALDRGATLVTANQRTAYSLRYAFDLRQRRNGKIHWQPPAIFSWEAWVSLLWQNLIVAGKATELLLNRFQEHSVWHSIVIADKTLASTLRSPDSLAESAARAWNLLAQYEGRERLRALSHNPEIRTFQRWMNEFESRCQSQQLLSRALLESSLAKAVQEGPFPLPASIALLGFDDHTPAQQRLLQAIRATGNSVEELSLSSVMARRSLARAEDEAHEITLAAEWIKKNLKDQPQARIAVIVPSIESRRSAIDRIFREILAPELQDIHAPHHIAPYEFSLGVPLSVTPLARVALDLLRWTHAPLPVERVSALLTSPLFAMQEPERSGRAVFDALELRKSRLLVPEISLSWLVKTIRKSKFGTHFPALAKALESIRHSQETLLSEPRMYSSWSDCIRNLLRSAHWGRASGEDSIEYQTRQKWEDSLDQLASLDFNSTPIPFEKALLALERIVERTMFAPESHGAPVQVMGPLEAAGSNFDAIWFLGAGDLTWPIRNTPVPLLPWNLQRNLKIPGADSAIDRLRAQRTTERIAASAPVVVFSYAAELTDGKQRPSPLLRPLDLQSISAAQLFPSELEPAPVALEEFSDRIPLPLVSDQVIPGGAEILKLQAACAFRAFAERRLGSTELREIDLGMDAAERGSVLHRVLEHFWKQVKTQASLKAMSPQERSATLLQAIQVALHRDSADWTEWEKAYLDLQGERLITLLNSWFEIELKRKAFTVLFSEEESRNFPIGPLHLNVRIDRVDRTEEGEMILDYKTGLTRSAQWFGERPDEPQLPLYAVLQNTVQPETPLTDIAFAQIRAGKDMALESYTSKITAEKHTGKPQPVPLSEQLTEWRRVLEKLAIGFYHGKVEVNPKDYPSTCAHCAQRILCRLNPAAFDEDLDEEEEATDFRDG